MTNTSDFGDFQQLWTTGKEEGIVMSKEEITRRTGRFERRLRLRNWIEYAAAVLVVGVFGWMALVFPGWPVKLACAALVIGTLVVVRNLAKHGPRSPDASVDCHSFYRGELVRQRDALLSVPRWYLAPFVPGMLMFLAAVAWETAKFAPLAVAVGPALLGFGIVALVFGGVWWLNRFAASKLDAEIAALDAA